jgi:hypothetical protein
MEGSHYPHSWPLETFNARETINSILSYWRISMVGNQCLHSLLLEAFNARKSVDSFPGYRRGLQWKGGHCLHSWLLRVSMEGRPLFPFFAIGGQQRVGDHQLYFLVAGRAVSIGLPSGGCCRGAPGGGGGLGLVMNGVWPRQGRLIPFHVHPHIQYSCMSMFSCVTPEINELNLVKFIILDIL